MLASPAPFDHLPLGLKSLSVVGNPLLNKLPTSLRALYINGPIHIPVQFGQSLDTLAYSITEIHLASSAFTKGFGSLPNNLEKLSVHVPEYSATSDLSKLYRLKSFSLSGLDLMSGSIILPSASLEELFLPLCCLSEGRGYTLATR